MSEPTDANHGNPTHGNVGEELRLLAEQLLERVEPVLRRTVTDNAEAGGCAWCPLCAAAALVRGEHHQVLSSLAEHGTAMVTILREALAGTPVAPLPPQEPTATPDAPETQHAPETQRPEKTDAEPDTVRFVNIPVTIRP